MAVAGRCYERKMYEKFMAFDGILMLVEIGNSPFGWYRQGRGDQALTTATKGNSSPLWPRIRFCLSSLTTTRYKAHQTQTG